MTPRAATEHPPTSTHRQRTYLAAAIRTAERGASERRALNERGAKAVTEPRRQSAVITLIIDLLQLQKR